MSVIGFIDKKFYSEYPVNWDNKLFRKKILEVLKPDDVVLDLGAGSGYVKEMNFRNEAGEVTGIDLDPGISKNPFLHSFIIGSVYELSALGEKKFDVIFCNSVIEHIDNPEKFVEEISRVLKPGGYFFGKTPNRNHYMPVIARITPLSFHKWFNRKRGRPEEHTFATHYKLNTASSIKKYFSANGWSDLSIETFEGPPSYLRMNFLFYTAGWLYERFVNTFKASGLRMVIIFSVRKSQ
jgi:ubiquinone/menaquinone biosynthesis C-methylase UbiE